MTTYSFYIDQLGDVELTWTIEQCKQQLDTSPGFFGALGNACLDEKNRRAMSPDAPPTELRIPWIVENEQQYLEACRWCTFGMLSAHEQQHYVFRNFLDVCREILFDQVIEAIRDYAQQSAGVQTH